jgi:hypothetical protein
VRFAASLERRRRSWSYHVATGSGRRGSDQRVAVRRREPRRREDLAKSRSPFHASGQRVPQALARPVHPQKPSTGARQAHLHPPHEHPRRVRDGLIGTRFRFSGELRDCSDAPHRDNHRYPPQHPSHSRQARATIDAHCRRNRRRGEGSSPSTCRRRSRRSTSRPQLAGAHGRGVSQSHAQAAGPPKPVGGTAPLRCDSETAAGGGWSDRHSRRLRGDGRVASCRNCGCVWFGRHQRFRRVYSRSRGCGTTALHRLGDPDDRRRPRLLPPCRNARYGRWPAPLSEHSSSPTAAEVEATP